MRLKKIIIFLVIMVVTMFGMQLLLPSDMLSLHKTAIFSLTMLVLIAAFYWEVKVVISILLRSKIEHVKLAFAILFLTLLYALYLTDFFTLNDFALDFVGYIFLVVFIQTLYEELFFRGIVLNYFLVKGISFYKAILYSAIIFSISHIFTIFRTLSISATINQLVIALLMGLLLGVLYVKIRNIYVLALAHMFFNLPGYFEDKAISTNTIDFTELTLLPFDLIQSITSLIGILIIYSPFVALTWYLLWRIKKTNKTSPRHVHSEHPFSLLNKKT